MVNFLNRNSSTFQKPASDSMSLVQPRPSGAHESDVGDAFRTPLKKTIHSSNNSDTPATPPLTPSPAKSIHALDPPGQSLEVTAAEAAMNDSAAASWMKLAANSTTEASSTCGAAWMEPLHPPTEIHTTKRRQSSVKKTGSSLVQNLFSLVVDNACIESPLSSSTKKTPKTPTLISKRFSNGVKIAEEDKRFAAGADRADVEAPFATSSSATTLSDKEATILMSTASSATQEVTKLSTHTVPTSSNTMAAMTLPHEDIFEDVEDEDDDDEEFEVEHEVVLTAVEEEDVSALQATESCGATMRDYLRPFSDYVDQSVEALMDDDEEEAVVEAAAASEAPMIDETPVKGLAVSETPNEETPAKAPITYHEDSSVPPILETFEMVLEERAPPSKKPTFWQIRRGRRSSKKDRQGSTLGANAATDDELDCVAHDETPVTAEELHEEESESFGDDAAGDVSPDPPVQDGLSEELELVVSPIEDLRKSEEELGEESANTIPDELGCRDYPPPSATRYSRKASKEARYKQLLGNMLNNRLAPVKEESVGSESETLTVRVPGLENPDMFLSSNDLIGDEYCISQEKTSLPVLMEEEDEVCDAVGTEFSTPESSCSDDCTKTVDISNNELLLTADEATTTLNETPKTKAAKSSRKKMVSLNLVTQSRKWIDQFNSCHSQNVAKAVVPDDVTAFTAGHQQSVEPALWKPAVCPNTGREYWYNRVTRESSWIMPPQGEAIHSEPEPKTQELEPFVRAKRSFNEVEAEEKKDETMEETREVIVEQVMPETQQPQETSELSFDNPAIDHENKVLAIKQDIVSILKTMSGPEGDNVDRLLTQYVGEEDLLLLQLLDIAESKPFDEPLEKDAKICVSKPPLGPNATPTLHLQRQVPPKAKALVARVQTYVTQVSNQSSSNITESTVQVKNTFNPNRKVRSGFETGSISSARQHHQQQHPDNATSATPDRPVTKVPSKVPVQRSRELVVEEFNTMGYKAETFDVRSGMVTTRRPFRPYAQNRPSAPSSSKLELDSEEGRHGLDDVADDKDGDTHDADLNSLPNDSISALSEIDYLLDRSDESQHDAEPETQGDWNFATAFSEGIRAVTAKSAPGNELSVSEWAQSELDRFISANEWDAVAKYISNVRADPPAAEAKSPEISPSKRFGARSQLQHDASATERYQEVQSFESWESGSFTSDESEDCSASVSSSESESLPRRARSSQAPPVRVASSTMRDWRFM